MWHRDWQLCWWMQLLQRSVPLKQRGGRMVRENVTITNTRATCHCPLRLFLALHLTTRLHNGAVWFCGWTDAFLCGFYMFSLWLCVTFSPQSFSYCPEACYMWGELVTPNYPMMWVVVCLYMLDLSRLHHASHPVTAGISSSSSRIDNEQMKGWLKWKQRVKQIRLLKQCTFKNKIKTKNIVLECHRWFETPKDYTFTMWLCWVVEHKNNADVQKKCRSST